MIKQLLAATVLATSAFGAYADNYDTMYLIKGDHVVGKYKVDDVDYATFTLPDGVSDENISVKLDNVGKNTVSYTVSTVNSTVAYAHNVLSFYDLEYITMDYFGDMFDNLSDEQKVQVMQYALSINAYVGMDSKQYTQTDFQEDGTGNGSRFSVMPGTRYFLCAWEIDPTEYTPRETFVYEEFKTKDAEAGKATIDCSYVETLSQGVHLNFTGSDVYYVRTCWGLRSTMDSYALMFGYDYLMGLFGQNWDLSYLQDSGELGEGVPNAVWPYDPSVKEYVMFVQAYDTDGNVTNKRFDITVDAGGDVTAGPSIQIFSKEKGTGYVKVNFEISPSNVEEAYVRLCGENFTDDRLNMGYQLHEIAMGGDAEDITSIINTTGEYTYTNSEVDEEWKSLLIYAKDKEGNRTTQRINFWPDSDGEWAIPNPVYGAPAVRMIPAVKQISSKRNPTLRKR